MILSNPGKYSVSWVVGIGQDFIFGQWAPICHRLAQFFFLKGLTYVQVEPLRDSVDSHQFNELKGTQFFKKVTSIHYV